MNTHFMGDLEIVAPTSSKLTFGSVYKLYIMR